MGLKSCPLYLAHFPLTPHIPHPFTIPPLLILHSQLKLHFLRESSLTLSQGPSLGQYTLVYFPIKL